MKNVTPLREFEYVPGQKITVPGVYRNMPMEVYHGDCCDGPSISSSGLRKIETKSPAHYFEGSYLNPNRKVEKDSEHFIFGRAAHLLLLGEPDFRKSFCIRPDTYPNDKDKAWNGTALDCKRWLAQAEKDRLTVLTSKQIIDIRGMSDALHEHPVVQAGILNGWVERAIFWRRCIIVDGVPVWIWLKARPDTLPIDADMISDLKSCESAHPADVRKAISDHGYHQQLALAAEGRFRTLGRRTTDFVLIFVEKTAPYAINHKPISLQAIEWGGRQNQRAIEKFAQAIHHQQWPAYDDDDEKEVGLTERLENRLLREDKDGLLPHDDAYNPQPEYPQADDGELV